MGYNRRNRMSIRYSYISFGFCEGVLMNRLESEFQSLLIKEIEKRFPDSMVLVKPGYYIQGFPDLLVLHRNGWALLECKRKRPTSTDDFEPNQEWYLEELGRFGFTAVIYPENREEILDEIQRSYGAG
jgi:hypothetical protein